VPQVYIRARALRLLSGREYGRAELTQRLMQDRVWKGPKQAIFLDQREVLIAAVLDELEAKGWLKDSRAAGIWAVRRAKGHGDAAIRQALRGRGFDEVCSAQAIQALDKSELDRACEAWDKRFKDTSTPGFEPDGDAWARNQAQLRWQAKQQRFLANRGFSADVIATVLKQKTTNKPSANRP
jgi:regulatory protein